MDLPPFSPAILRPPDGRLVAAGLRTLANIARTTGLTGTDAATLLGVSRATYYRLQQTAAKERQGTPREKATYREQLANAVLQERLSLLLGIYGDLQTYYAKDRAAGDAWVRTPNANPVFGGHAPIELMLSGSVVALWTVRRFTEVMLS